LFIFNLSTLLSFKNSYTAVGSKYMKRSYIIILDSVADPDLYVFGLHGSLVVRDPDPSKEKL